jgi:hypothetical protein
MRLHQVAQSTNKKQNNKQHHSSMMVQTRRRRDQHQSTVFPKLESNMTFLLSMAVFAIFLLTQPRALAAVTKMDNTPPPPATSSSSTSSSSSSKWASIHGRLRLPDPAQSLNSTRITLNDGTTHSTYTLPEGSFVFRRVPPGVHLLDVQSRVHHFSQVKVQILPGSMDSPRCVEYAYPGAAKQAVP